MRNGPRWRLLPPAPPSAVERLSAHLKVHPRLAAILWARGLRDDAADQLEPPFALSDIPQLEPAAERLAQAIEHGRRLRIHGDYDADGISGTAVLVLGLRALGAQVDAFLPHRLDEGYGIHPDRVDDHAAACDLFLTVDCGISNLREIERLQAAGVEVIVSDHHAPGERLPDCLVVHPSTSPQARPGRPELTGAGVAYHLLWAVHRRLGVPEEETQAYLDLATIGTVADVATLLGENRALVKRGLERMQDSAWAGIRAMMKLSRLRQAPTARDVAFLLAPRFNAAGRLGEAGLGLELMTTASERRALELATLLDQYNRQRGEIQAAMLESALTKVDAQAPAIVVEDADWHKGVMGIVASHLLERFHKPVFIVANGAGSVRSLPGISAVGALAAASEHLGRWGGHAQAAGFGLDMARFTDFRQAIYDHVEAQPPVTASVVVDALLDLDEIDLDLFRTLGDLEPYGQGHPAPRFLLHGRLQHARAVGKGGAHLQLRLGDEGPLGRTGAVSQKGVAFKKGNLADTLPLGAEVHAAVQLSLNEYNGSRSVEFQADGLRPAGPLSLGDEVGEVPIGRIQLQRSAGDNGLRIDPSAEDPLAGLRHLLRDGRTTASLHLSDEQLADLEAEADAWPSLADVRKAWVARSRRQDLPFREPLAGRIEAVLHELGAYDASGRVRLGRKVEPYDSPSLRAGLVRRYLLRTLVQAYRHLDDAGFTATVLNLAEVAGGADGADGAGDGDP